MTPRRTRAWVLLIAALACIGMGTEAYGDGACCMTDGSCQVLSEIACNSASGFFNGDGTVCADFFCGSAACCRTDGTCTSLPLAACFNEGGFYAGEGVVCAALNCGACFFGNGDCLPMPEDICGAETNPLATRSYGGIFLAGGNCATLGLIEVRCCFQDGTCQVMTLIECVSSDAASGTGDEPGFPSLYLTDCADPCVGACCLPSGCVQALTETDCESSDPCATWLGPNTDCADAPAGSCYADVEHIWYSDEVVGTPFTLPVPTFSPLGDGSDPCLCSVCDGNQKRLVGMAVIVEQTLTGRISAVNDDPEERNPQLTYTILSDGEFPNTGTPLVAWTSAEATWSRVRTMGVAGSAAERVDFGDFVWSAADNHPTPNVNLVDDFDHATGLLTAQATLDAFDQGAGAPANYDLMLWPRNIFSFDGAGNQFVLFEEIAVITSMRVIYFWEPTSSIAGRIWEDENCDGCQPSEDGETPAAGVTVELYDDGGILVASEITDAFGRYCFSELDPGGDPLPEGDYEIRIDRIANGYGTWEWTIANSDNCDDTLDSDFVPVEPARNIGIVGVTVVAGECLENIDGGFVDVTYNLSGNIFQDDDCEGCSDGDPGFPGVTVELYTDGGIFVDDDTTNGNGDYAFNDLSRGCYEVRVDLEQAALTDWFLTLANSCPDEESDSDLVKTGTIARAFVCLEFGPEHRPDNCLVTEVIDGGFCDEEPPPLVCGCGEKGSVVYFHKVEIRWDSAGNLLQDTFLQMSNDWPEDVEVQLFYVNGDPELEATESERYHPGWNWADNKFVLTGNQPTVWSAFSGDSTVPGLSPFTVLDPGSPPGRPAMDGTSDRVLRGYVVAWPVNEDCEEIRWNHLSGMGTLVNYQLKTSWDYDACTLVAVFDTDAGGAETPAHGEQTGDPGVLNLDGLEFASPPARNILHFQGTGSSAWSSPDAMVTTNTDLTIYPASVDFRDSFENEGPITTKISVIVYNENEHRLAETFRCITCWDQTLVSMYSDPNSFLISVLGTDHGYAIIDGIVSAQCPDSQSAALLGVAARHLTYDGGEEYGASSQSLINCECETAVIRYDPLAAPPPKFESQDATFQPLGIDTAEHLVDLLRNHQK